MPHLMQRGAAWLGERLQTAAGQSVVFTRHNQVAAAITGSFAKHEYEVADAEGMITTVLSYDWTFTTTEMPWTVRPGDRFRVDDESYEVTPIGSKPASERLDADGVLTLVHTKKVS